MENKEVNNNEESMSAKGGFILIVAAFVLGSIVGANSANKKINEAYSKGVVDTFQSILLRSK